MASAWTEESDDEEEKEEEATPTYMYGKTQSIFLMYELHKGDESVRTIKNVLRNAEYSKACYGSILVPLLYYKMFNFCVHCVLCLQLNQ